MGRVIVLPTSSCVPSCAGKMPTTYTLPRCYHELAKYLVSLCRALLEAHVVPPFLKPRNMSAAWSHLQACRASTADLQALYASATATSTALQQPAAASIMDPLLKVGPATSAGLNLEKFPQHLSKPHDSESVNRQIA